MLQSRPVRRGPNPFHAPAHDGREAYAAWSAISIVQLRRTIPHILGNLHRLARR